MEENIKISIITTSYDSEKTIEQTIKSVLRQKYKNIEYIIIDGKSKDLTCDIVKKYLDSIDVFVSEPDSGIYSAWNKGVNKATGDYVFMLNSDDTLYDDTVIEDVVNELVHNRSPNALYAKLKAFEEGSNYSYIDGKQTCLNEFVYRMNFCTLTAFINKKVYSEIGLYDEQYKISSDYDFAIRLFKNYDPETLVFYDRITINFGLEGRSNKQYKKAYKEVAKIIKNHFDKNDYVKHLMYNKFIIFIKYIMPIFRNTGILDIWRKIKQKLL